MRLRKQKDDYTQWPETIESARLIIKACRAMNIEPNEFLLRVAGEDNEQAGDFQLGKIG